MGVRSAADGLGGGLDAVNAEDLQALGHFHVVGVVVDGVADGVGGVVIALHGTHQAGHVADDVFRRRVHQRRVAHDQLFHQRLGACALVALEGDDLLVVAADLAPVGDLAGVDPAHLLGGQVIHRVVFVDHEDQAVGGDGLDVGLEAGLVHLVIDRRVGLTDDENVAVTPHQVAEGLGRAVELDQIGHLVAALAQQDAGDGLTHGHHGGGAVHAGEILAGEGEIGGFLLGAFLGGLGGRFRGGLGGCRRRFVSTGRTGCQQRGKQQNRDDQRNGFFHYKLSFFGGIVRCNCTCLPVRRRKEGKVPKN